MLGIVVPERHEDVARVADHDDVAHLRVVGQRVERQVALDEAAVRLRLELARAVAAMSGLRWSSQGETADTAGRGSSGKTSWQHDVLHPGRARLVGGRDHDVAGARREAVPVAAVEDVADGTRGSARAGQCGHAVGRRLHAAPARGPAPVGARRASREHHREEQRHAGDREQRAADDERREARRAGQRDRRRGRRSSAAPRRRRSRPASRPAGCAARSTPR